MFFNFKPHRDFWYFVVRLKLCISLAVLNLTVLAYLLCRR